MTKLMLSPQQKAVLDFIKDDTRSLVVTSVAGSGKTFILVEGIKLMKGDIFVGAFNKKIAVELESRCTKKFGLTISTMHAAGLSAWRQHRAVVDGDKLNNLFKERDAERPGLIPYRKAIMDLVSFAKQAAVGILYDVNNNAVWENLINHFNVDTLGEDEMVISEARLLLDRSTKQCFKVIDFDDMLYAPLFYNATFKKYDWVLIDEGQDTNATRRELALRMMKPNGRMMVVGDERQAIYGFTGADSDALDLIQNATNAQRMALSVSFRCPKNVVNYAKKFVNHIEAAPEAIDGYVAEIDLTKDKFFELINPGDAILCRYNAPLINTVYKFISRGIPAKIEGRDIGSGLKTLASRWKVKTYDELYAKLDHFLNREAEKLKLADQEYLIAGVDDRVQCLKVVIARCETNNPKPVDVVQSVVREIDQIFGDNLTGSKKCVVLSSIHRSKGLEWQRVVWLTTGPSKFARKRWEHEAEQNLMYVAATRSQDELLLIDAESIRNLE